MPRLSGILVLVKFKFWLQEIDAITPFCRILVQSPEVAGVEIYLKERNQRAESESRVGRRALLRTDTYIKLGGRLTGRQKVGQTMAAHNMHISQFISNCVCVLKNYTFYTGTGPGVLYEFLCVYGTH